ncbi:MAG: hypothetical protein GY868_18445 [Deltaproteobacteria bacterium]|nr:hypothetical protein [Deltaproteobacteria bacterium]
MPVSAEALDVFILKSKNIIPYNSCIDGIKLPLSDYTIQTADADGNLEKGLQLLTNIAGKKPKVIIAVGPQAAHLLARQPWQAQPLFCMVLNPDKLLSPAGLYSGVSLNIPLGLQVQKIAAAFPARPAIGVFYNPKTNQKIMDTLQREAAKHQRTIRPLAITSANDVPALIASAQFAIDILLFIPDDRLKSTKIVEYIIKKSLRKKIPVVGYNRWFTQNGAVLSFAIDYQSLGFQTGTMARGLLEETGPAPVTIAYPEKIRLSVNIKTAGKLGITVSPEIISQADEVIK